MQAHPPSPNGSSLKESLSILAQTICSTPNVAVISAKNYILPPCKSKIRLRNINTRYTRVLTFLRVFGANKNVCLTLA